MSDFLAMPLPPWVPIKREKDQWKLLSKLRSEALASAGGRSAWTYLKDRSDH
jgi:hypothetical protein